MQRSDPPRDPAGEGKSPVGLVGDVVRQGSNLIQQEIQMAKAELSEKMSQVKMAIGEIIAGTVMLIVSLGILLAALVSGVARLLVGLFGDAPAETAAIATDGLDAGTADVVATLGRNMDAALDAARTLPTYEGLAALLVGTVFAVIGGLLLRNGLGKLDADALAPDRTLRQVRKDGELAREQV